MNTQWFEQTPDKGDGKLLENAGLDFEINKQTIHLPDGQKIDDFNALVKGPNASVFFRTVPADFEPLQTDDFLKLTMKVAGNVQSAGHTDDDSYIWFTTTPKDSLETYKVNGEIYANYIIFAMSPSAKIGLSIVPLAVNVTRNIAFNVSELLNIKTPTLRQTKRITERVNDNLDEEDLQNTYDECLTQLDSFQSKLIALTNKTINFDEALDNLLPPTPGSKSSMTRLQKLRGRIKHNYDASRGDSAYALFVAIYTTDAKSLAANRNNLARRYFARRVSPSAQKVIEKAA